MVIVVSLLVLPHVEYDRSVIDLALTVLGGLIAWPYEVALSFVERMKLPHAKAIAACALLAIAILLDISLHSIRRKLKIQVEQAAPRPNWRIGKPRTSNILMFVHENTANRSRPDSLIPR
jgi:hypothetical protein